MNELIESLIGKRCIITGDISSSCVGTILSVKENWIEIANEKGEKSLLNAQYISVVKEYPEKKKKNA